MKSTHLGPLIALSALAVAPSVAFADTTPSTPGTSIATTAEPAPALTSPADAAIPVQSTPQASSEAASTPSSSTPASTPSASTPVDTTPQASDPNLADVTDAVKGESSRRAARRKAQQDQASRTDPAPSEQATDPTLIDPSLLNVTAVPNFFIQDFDIPPFLLPIYQAAGSEYGIPWQVLAGINKVETDYGRNLNVSSAGAEGYMQFMPSTWAQYGVDANGDGVKDPYNPEDAIFAAARYLKAAGGDTNIQQGVFAYNHASWYVDEVMANARAVAALPDSVINSLTGLTHGIFPVAGDTNKIEYAGKTDAPTDKVSAGTNAADPVEGSATRDSIEITADQGSKVVATQDGVIDKVGENSKLGKYVRVKDSYGNSYTYAHLGEIQDEVPVPKSVPQDTDPTKESESASDPAGSTDSAATTDDSATTPSATTPDTTLDPSDPAPTSPATVDPTSTSPTTPDATTPTTPAATTPGANALSTTPTAPEPSATSRNRLARSGETSDPETTDTSAAETPRRIRYAARDASTAPNTPAEPVSVQSVRLYAHPELPNPYANGGAQQLGITTDTAPTIDDQAPVGELSKYFTVDYGLKASDVNLKKLKAGQAVIAGTVLGKTQVSTDGSGKSKVTFQIRPAGDAAPKIDPSPILDGWRLQNKTSFTDEQAQLAQQTGQDPADPSVGQILLMGKEELQQRVLADKRISIYSCGRRDIEAGEIDQRILALLEVMASKDMTPVVSSLKCGHSDETTGGEASAHADGDAVDISSVYGQQISASTQGPGSVTDKAERVLLQLQGDMKPDEIISLMKYQGYDNTLALPDHFDHLHVSYKPQDGSGKDLKDLLKPGQWDSLVKQLGSIQLPGTTSASTDATTPTTPDQTK